MTGAKPAPAIPCRTAEGASSSSRECERQQIDNRPLPGNEISADRAGSVNHQPAFLLLTAGAEACEESRQHGAVEADQQRRPRSNGANTLFFMR